MLKWLEVKVVIVSGYFNPLHGGHLDMIEAARELGDKLIVIVNNDQQQVLKKGKIILDEQNRLRLMRALKGVDQVILSIDGDPTIIKTLAMVAGQYPGDGLIFANGGDRSSEKAVPETEICKKNNIEMVFGVGGDTKSDSSTRINQATGKETEGAKV
jgi:glycerol-3-phosphate cytidylyltransferase/D-beta-D-heptose 7-phosphate kinase/D-beta-D-heptose 1-phosphate adenosyltransferase